MNDEPLNLDEMFRLMADIQRLRREQEQAMAHDEGIPRRAEEIEREARIEAAAAEFRPTTEGIYQQIRRLDQQIAEDQRRNEERQRQFVNNFFHNEPIRDEPLPRTVMNVREETAEERRFIIEEARRQERARRRMPPVQPPPRGPWVVGVDPIVNTPPPQPVQRIPTQGTGLGPRPDDVDPWDEIEGIGAGNPNGLGNHLDRIEHFGDMVQGYPSEASSPPPEPENILGKAEDHFL